VCASGGSSLFVLSRNVTGLVAPSVVNTMPEATLNAVAGHGQIPGDSIHGSYEQPHAVLDELAEHGIGYKRRGAGAERPGSSRARRKL
jgi:transaldolase